MRDKYANKTPVKRFFHKYTGFIICGIILAVAIPWFYYTISDQFFFEKWSCGMVYSYLFNQGNVRDVPLHNELTEEQHQRLHEIYEECRAMQPPYSEEFQTHE